MIASHCDAGHRALNKDKQEQANLCPVHAGLGLGTNLAAALVSLDLFCGPGNVQHDPQRDLRLGRFLPAPL